MTEKHYPIGFPSISAVVIIKDEEINLPGIILSLGDWVDEIVIVDDNSSDNSREIARAAGGKVKLISHPMKDEEGFAGQRNAGIRAAKGNWLLHMDCDERVTPELATEILSAALSTTLNGFRYKRVNYFLNRPMSHGGWGGWNRPQLARRGKHQFEGKLHEQCVIEGGQINTGQLNSPMLHFNDEDFGKRLRKSAKYVEMQVSKRNISGTRVSGARIIVLTVFEFTKKYLLKRGFLDGTPGLIAAIHSATSVFRTESLVWDQQNHIQRSVLEREISKRWNAAQLSSYRLDER